MASSRFGLPAQESGAPKHPLDMMRKSDDAQGSEAEPGDGTQMSGYVTPDLGPFECENCEHFTSPDQCDHPFVIADPEVRGSVEAEGCCNYFKSAGRETQEQEHEEGMNGSAKHP